MSLLEIVRLCNAASVNCQFGKSVRYDLARRDGLTEDKVDQIRDGYEESLSRRRKTSDRVRRRYLDDPAGMSKELAAHLKQHFWPGRTNPSKVAPIAFNATSRRAVTIGGMPENLPITELVRALEVIFRGNPVGCGVPARHGSSREA